MKLFLDTADVNQIREAWSWGIWWLAFAASLALTIIFLICIVVIFTRGIGVWGLNTAVVWGFDIANYVWWIGIGNAGTLISSMLLLMRRGRHNETREPEMLRLPALAGG